jgi:Bifunctional DNA primase/polymerase, N-terminal
VSVREHIDPCHYQGRKSALLASALGYAARGMHVFPVRVGRKQPLWDRWESRATRDPDTIRRVWNRAPYNVGVACGPSGLVIIDLDVLKSGSDGPPKPYPGATCGTEVLTALAKQAGQPWPITMAVTTPSGGRHLIFRSPPKTKIHNSARTVAWCIDVRACGGYVLGIGSFIGDRPYRLENSTPPALLPRWLHQLITSPDELTKGGRPWNGSAMAARLAELAYTGTRQQRWAAAALAGACQDLALMPAGSGRNNRLNGIAYRFGRLAAGGALTEDDIRVALTAAAQAAGLTDYETEHTITSGITAGQKAPRRWSA